MKTLQFGERPCVNTFVIGEVLRVHVKNEFWREGGFPILLARNLPLQFNPHTYPVAAVQANPRLRPRIGNPDERRSNRLIQTLEALKSRVTDPEPGLPAEIHGAVIAALNEEAVASAALANKGGTYSP